MKTRVESTLVRRGQGYNCAQAVACTYRDLLGVDEKTVFRAIEGFGAGMGCMEGACGALAGAVLLAGLKYSDGDLEAPKSKGKTYQVTKEMVKRFQEKGGSVICKDLKAVENGKQRYDCAECIKDAARIVEELLFGEENE